MEARELFELERVERTETASGHHQVRQLGQGGEGGGLQSEAFETPKREMAEGGGEELCIFR